MVGNNTVSGRFSFFEKYLKWFGIQNEAVNSSVVEKVLKAVESLRVSKTGALIVFSKVDNPSFVNSGVLIDAVISVKLLETIFQ